MTIPAKTQVTIDLYKAQREDAAEVINAKATIANIEIGVMPQSSFSSEELYESLKAVVDDRSDWVADTFKAKDAIAEVLSAEKFHDMTTSLETLRSVYADLCQLTNTKNDHENDV